MMSANELREWMKALTDLGLLIVAIYAARKKSRK